MKQIIKTEDEEFDETNANSEGLSFDFAKNLTQQFGITPGMSIQEQRQQRAEENGLSFACVGRQPVDDILENLSWSSA